MQNHGVNPMDDTVQLRYFLHKSQVVGNSDDNITSAVREYSFSSFWPPLQGDCRNAAGFADLATINALNVHCRCRQDDSQDRGVTAPHATQSLHLVPQGTKIPVDAIQILPKLRTNQPKHLHAVSSRRNSVPFADLRRVFLIAMHDSKL